MELHFPEGISEIEVVVVDNSAEEEGRSVLNEFVNIPTRTFKYDLQSVKNISLTRNKAVSLATGEIICFIDDDGKADADWLVHMYACLLNNKADGVFGKVIPYFEDGVEEWIVKGKFFERPDEQDGSITKNTRTTNCIIYKSVINQVDGPFDPAFGITGGEDSNLFKKLAAKGCKFVYSQKGIVYDFIPKSRANLVWLIRRHYRTGITNTLVRMQVSKNKVMLGLYFLSRYTLFFLIGITSLVLCLPIKTKRNYWLLKLAGIAGHFAYFFSLNYDEYK